MIRYFKKSLLVFLAVMMVITFIPGAGFADKAYAAEPPVTSIELVLPEPIVLYENTGGSWSENITYDESNNEIKDTFYSYSDHVNFVYREGSKVILEREDGTKVEYPYDQDMADFYNPDRGTLNEFYLVYDQDVKHWTVDGDNKLTAEFEGKTCYVPVTIAKSPIKNVSFEPSKFTVYENAGGYWDEGVYWYYTEFLYKEGNSIIVTGMDDKKTVYTYGPDKTGENWDYYTKDGEKAKYAFIENQYEDNWLKGKTNTITLECLGQTCQIPVEVEENPVKEISFKPVKDIVLYNELGGYMDEYIDYENGTSDKYFCYENWDTYVYRAGNRFIVTLTNGSNKIYEYRYNEAVNDYDFFSVSGERLTDYLFNDNQYEDHWYEGGDNYIIAEYLGKKCKIPVKIIDNPVKEILFEPGTPIELFENTDGVWSTREEEGEEKDYFHYDYSLFEEGNRFIIKYNDGTEKVYLFNADEVDYFTESGEQIDSADWEWYDNQYDEPFKPGINYSYIFYKGIEGKIKILVKHVFEVSSNTATCTEKGTATYICKECGEKEELPSDPTGHSWGEWTVTKEATETEEGVETRVCKNDSSHKETRAIPKKEPGATPEPTEPGEDIEPISPVPTDPDENEPLESEIRKAISKGAAAEAATKAITSVRTDKDLKGSVFNKLKVKQSKATKTSITVSWSKVKNAKKYVVYAGKSGKNNKVKKIATLKSTKTKYTLKKFNKKKLTKGTYYKFAVVALDKNGKVITSSKFAHVATKGKNAKSNPAKVTVSSKIKKNKITLKVKKTFKLKGKYASSAKKYKIRKILDVRYESTKPKVAKVSSKGVITAKKKGTCYIYVYAQNGLYKKIKVTVKK